MKHRHEHRAILIRIRRYGEATRTELAESTRASCKEICLAGLLAGLVARTAHRANEVRELTDALSSIVLAVDAIITITQKHRRNR